MDFSIHNTATEEAFLYKIRKTAPHAWDGMIQRCFFLNRSQTKSLIVALDFGNYNFQPTLSIRGHKGVVHIAGKQWTDMMKCLRRAAVTAFRPENKRSVEEAITTLTQHTVQTLCYATGNLIKISDREDSRAVIFLGEPSVRRLLDLEDTLASLLKHYDLLQVDVVKWYSHFIKLVDYKLPADNMSSEHKNLALAQMRSLIAKDPGLSFDSCSLYSEIGEDKIYSDLFLASDISAHNEM